jgi:hypothetical protein
VLYSTNVTTSMGHHDFFFIGNIAERVSGISTSHFFSQCKAGWN